MYKYLLVFAMAFAVIQDQRKIFGGESSGKIDRQAVIGRHDPVNEKADPLGALSVGNGRFAFTVDITGLQSFPEAYDAGIPLGMESEWGWHSAPDSAGYRYNETLRAYNIHGREITYSVQLKDKAVDYYRENPHRLQLGNIGLELTKQDGTAAALADLHDIHQELILWYDSATHRYILGPELIPAQERFGHDSTVNPCFELAYWRWALSVAQQWRVRLGMKADAGWQRVIDGLADLPQHNGLYYPAENAVDAYTNPRYRGDHPAVLATYGFLPATRGMDTAVMHATFNWVAANWDWASTWGWDFPLMAMAATRLGSPDQAIDALLMPVAKNTYLTSGHNYQDGRLRLYLPGNGGLLAAVAMMCAGYDGCRGGNPEFPTDGRWKVRWEGLRAMP